MKISNETKVGLLAIVAIVLLVLGFNFLKGQNIFSKAPVLYAKFNNIGSLEKSNLVKINGLPVGTVYNLTPTDQEVNGILVEIHLNRDISIPRNSLAFIDGSLVGAAFINIEKGPSNAYLQSGDTISTELKQGLMANIQTQLSPTITRVNETLDSLKLTIGSVNSIFDPATNNNLRDLIANLTLSTAQLHQLLASQSSVLGQTLGNLNSVSANLARNNDAITSSLRNVEVTTAKLANANIEQVVSALQGTITELRGTVAQLNSPDGTLGALTRDRQLYDQLNRAALSLEILLDDVRVHPKRYVNVSVFGGRKAAEPLTSPAAKDTIAVITE